MVRKIKPLLLVIIGLWPILSNISHADWITNGYFSDATGIDSIERFLVIPDVTDSTYFGWHITAAGDVNDDGLSDVLIGRLNKSWSNHNTYLFFGGNPPDTIFDAEFTDFNIALANIGDVNDDGYDDFAESDGIYGKAMIYYGGPLLDDTADLIFNDVRSYFPKAVDLDGDGTLDLALSESVNGGVIKIFSLELPLDSLPKYILADTAQGFGKKLVTGDFNGDGFADVAVNSWTNHESDYIKFYWGGPDFDTIPDFEIPGYNSQLGKFMQPLGDYNGDGYGDIFIGGNSPVRYGIYFGGPDIDDVIDIPINYDNFLSFYVPTSVDLAGDINCDGYPDLIIGRLLGFLTEIFIYLGGPDADSIFDINIENYDMPGSQNSFGHVVAGIGDFNGDGADDFAVRSQTEPSICWTSEVNFFAGWNGTATDVDDEDNSSLPEVFELYQNHPNPFNPMTTIEFELPRKDIISLSIFNVLGQRIRTIVHSKQYTPGKYTVFWDSRQHQGYIFTSCPGQIFPRQKR